MSNKYDNVLSCVLKDEVVKLTQDLVRIDSVIRPSKGVYEEDAAVFIAGYLRKLGFDVIVDEVEPHRPNIIAVLEGDEPGKCILFEGHTDVVTEGIGEKWNYPPFEAVIDNGRIYGRGACDTKGNIAAMIVAAKAIKESGQSFCGKIKLCIPVDEEGMMIGIKDFIKKGYADDVDAAVICEPEENNACIKQKGAMRVVIRMYGKQCHGAMPLSGINPIPKAAKLIAAVMDFEAEEKGMYGKDEYLGWPSITPTIFSAPSDTEPQINVVPGELKLALDVRTIPGQDHDYIEDRLRRIIRGLEYQDEEFRAVLEVIEQRPWTATPVEHEVVKAVTMAYEEVSGRKMVYNGVPGATDGTFLDAWKGIKVVTIGAGNRQIPHRYDEYVDIEELMEAAKVYALTALYYLNGEGS